MNKTRTLKVLFILILVVASAALFKSQDIKLSLENFLKNTASVITSGQDSITIDKGDVGGNIIGLWKSLDTEGYEMEFSKEGVMTERLGQNQTVGSWDLIDFNEGPNDLVVGAVLFTEEGIFLKQSLDEGRADFYYKVVKANEEDLNLMYLHQGGRLLLFEKARN